MTVLVLLLCGVPGAGKTQLARQIASAFEATHTAIIHFDHYEVSRLDWDENSFKNSRNAAVQAFEALIESMKSDHNNTSLSSSPPSSSSPIQLVLLDDLFYLRSMRKRIFQICREKGLLFASLFLRVDLEDALLRNRSRAADSFVSEEVQYHLHIIHILFTFHIYAI